MKNKSILNYILILNATFVLGAFGQCRDKTTKEDSQKPTKLTYTIDVSETDKDGFYVVQRGKNVTISASATGPNKDEVKWSYNLVLDKKDMSGNPELAKLSKNVQARSVEEKLTLTANTPPMTITLDCHPSEEKYEGKQTFKIKFESGEHKQSANTGAREDHNSDTRSESEEEEEEDSGLFS